MQQVWGENRFNLEKEIHKQTYIQVNISLGLVSLFNGISTFVGYFNAKAILLEQ